MIIKISSFLIFIIIALLFFKKNKDYDCVVIRGGHFFDSSTNNMSPNKELILKNNSISFDGTPSNSCFKINLNDHYILPGLIDSHTHLLSADRQTVQTWKQALEISASRPAMSRLYIGEKNSKYMLRAGFTTVRDLGNSGDFLDVALRDRIQNLISVGPDLIISGPALATLNTQINVNLNPAEYAIINANTDLTALLLEYKKKNISWIKLYADNSHPSEIVDINLLRSVVDTAHQQGFKVAIHSTYSFSVDNALLASPDSIEHFSYAPEIPYIEQDKKPFVVLTDFSLKTCQQSRVEENCNNTINEFKKRIDWLKKNNFILVFGSDAVLDFTNKFNNRGEASLSSLLSLAEFGLSNLEIILSATSNAAQMLDIKAGKILNEYQADLVIYSSNPLENIQILGRPKIVISNGKVVCRSEVECAL